MNIALTVARVLLAIVFIVAGLAKLADLEGSRKSVADFGVPAQAAPALGLALPLGEIVVALALLPQVSAWWGAVGALAFLLLFVGAISYNLARGRRPDCNCFGQVRSEPIGRSTLVRDGILAVVAVFIIVAGRQNPGTSVIAWMGQLSAIAWIGLILAVALVLAVAAEGWVLYQVMQLNGRLITRLEALEAGRMGAEDAVPESDEPLLQPGLPFGSVAPEFNLKELRGEEVALQDLRAAEKPVVLTFIEPDCGSCATLLPKIGRWQRDYADKLTITLISTGTPAANDAKTSAHGITNVLLQRDYEVAQAYHTNAFPSAVVVKPDGTVGSTLLRGPDQIISLVATLVDLPPRVALPVPVLASQNGNGNRQASPPAPPRPAAPKLGEAAPTVQLPDLRGEMVDLAEFRGSKTLVLFWNPSCGFCQRMLDDLKAWEAKPRRGAPKLLVVSTGSAHANEEQGISAPVLLDEGFRVAHAFGAHGTPSAVLVDAEGKIASEVQVGKPAVLALASAGRTPALSILGRR